jgi:hypothetical protein
LEQGKNRLASRSSISGSTSVIPVRPLAEHDYYSLAPAFVDLRREVTQQRIGGRMHVQCRSHGKKQRARLLCHVTIVTLRL